MSLVDRIDVFLQDYKWLHSIWSFVWNNKVLVFLIWAAGWVLKILLVMFVFKGCNEDNYVPKPKAYQKVVFPDKSYQAAVLKECPFSFEIPDYTSIKKDSLFFGSDVQHPCWMDLVFDEFKGTLHLSYKPLHNDDDLSKLADDSHFMTFKHTVKATSIEDSLFYTPNDLSGILYDVSGDAASHLQFILTDTSRHFLRGALYFNAEPNADSLSPIVDFVEADMWHLINTFTFN